MKFKILAGRHVGRDANGKQIIYMTGEIVETNVDLVAKFNHGDWSRKFELVDESPVVDTRRVSTQTPVKVASGPTSATQATTVANSPVSHTPPTKLVGNLDNMGIKELQQLAADEEIDLKGATRKEDMVRLIKAAL